MYVIQAKKTISASNRKEGSVPDNPARLVLFASAHATRQFYKLPTINKIFSEFFAHFN